MLACKGDRMHNREPTQSSGELAVNTLLPILQRLEWEIQSISERVHQFVPRKSLSETVKAQHRHIVVSLGGRCPCYGFVILVDPGGRLLAGEYDHFYSRERNAFEDTWLICKDCHLSMKDRAEYIDEFRTYQRRAAAIEGDQLQLI